MIAAVAVAVAADSVSSTGDDATCRSAASDRDRDRGGHNDVLPSSSSITTIPAVDFYGEYHGHTVKHLETVRAALETKKGGGCGAFVYLVGDSTLDNKHWIFLENDSDFVAHNRSKAEALPELAAAAVNGYETVLDPPRMVRDVAYWMNHQVRSQTRSQARSTTTTTAALCTINAAVEESTVSERDNGASLLPQDAFVARNAGPNDTVVVSMGGNDLALRPSTETQQALRDVLVSPSEAVDDGTAPGFDHLLNLFHDKVERILESMLLIIRGERDQLPKLVVVCALYYPDEASAAGGWADPVLEQLGYNTDPSGVQRMLRSLHKQMERRGFPSLAKSVTVRVFPMFEVLDGKHHGDYVQRVEPSTVGGQKLAGALLEWILPAYDDTTVKHDDEKGDDDGDYQLPTNDSTGQTDSNS
eukprot:jgi/Psemu1/200327/e_gw1.256.2.1